MEDKRGKSVLIMVITVTVCLGAAFFVYQPLWEDFSDFRPWSLGLDLAGGTYLVYEIDLSGVASEDRGAVVRGLRDVIERRVNLFGVSEPRVYTESVAGRERLVAELAGVFDVDEAKEMIGETPLLDFREVEEGEDGELVFVPTALTGRYVRSASFGFNQYTREPEVYIEFDREGAEIFAELTERNLGEPLAIFLDGSLIQMPVVRDVIIGGQAQISGGFTRDEARLLVERFNAGALPAPISLVNEYTVSADLGLDSLNKIMMAGLVGFLAVVAFMIVYYRRFGFFASLALLIYVVLLLAIFKIIPVTMTLAGIAGIVLSVGIAVDANILIFERIKEELRKGSSSSVAVEEGFNRAWNPIKDANVSTLIGAVIIYYFTTSFMQGFALALFVGVMLSMFSAIVVTRTLLRIFHHYHA